MSPQYFNEEMSFLEASLIYEGYKRKEYLEKWKVQRLGYLIAQFSGRAKKSLKPSDIVNLDTYEEEFQAQFNDLEFTETKEVTKEDTINSIQNKMDYYKSLVHQQ